jgi:hypothetical protein
VAKMVDPHLKNALKGKSESTTLYTRDIEATSHCHKCTPAPLCGRAVMFRKVRSRGR